MDTYNLADDNPNVNIKSFILDPLSVIVKLAIIGNKPIGTKILLQNNIISFQEPGYFQGISRIFYKSNKTDIQYLFNPIYLACLTFLSINDDNKFPEVNVYRYVVSINDKNNKLTDNEKKNTPLSTDELLYQKAELKYLVVKEVEQALKEVAIDCPLLLYGNISSLLSLEILLKIPSSLLGL